MTVVTNNRLPVGLQSFKKIREGNYLYVDKSDIIWQLANNGLQYNFLSRPQGLIGWSLRLNWLVIKA